SGSLEDQVPEARRAVAMAAAAPSGSVFLLNVPEDRHRRRDHPADVVAPSLRHEVLAKRNVENLIQGMRLEFLRNPQLLLRSACGDEIRAQFLCSLILWPAEPAVFAAPVQHHVD